MQFQDATIRETHINGIRHYSLTDISAVLGFMNGANRARAVIKDTLGPEHLDYAPFTTSHGVKNLALTTEEGALLYTARTRSPISVQLYRAIYAASKHTGG